MQPQFNQFDLRALPLRIVEPFSFYFNPDFLQCFGDAFQVRGGILPSLQQLLIVGTHAECLCSNDSIQYLRISLATVLVT